MHLGEINWMQVLGSCVRVFGLMRMYVGSPQEAWEVLNLRRLGETTLQLGRAPLGTLYKTVYACTDLGGLQLAYP